MSGGTGGGPLTLTLVLGDQLSHTSPALPAGPGTDTAVLMIEAPGEAAHVWSHRARITLFLAAMRHFRDELRERGFTVHYVALGDSEVPDLPGRLREQLLRLRPQTLRLVEAGEWRLQQAIAAVVADTVKGTVDDAAADFAADAAADTGTALRVLDDTHFLCSRADFARWAGTQGRSLRMEFFYREMRRQHRVLLDADSAPEGGRWNHDTENRKGYPRAGPGLIPPAEGFAPDALTREVMAEVAQRFAGHPGSLEHFAWPVNRAQALLALQTFVQARLPNFGAHQDAMWTSTPFGWHSLLSTSLNLHLLDPREVIAAAEAAYRSGAAPIASVEGFVRQVLGWREFVRGVYWQDMPAMAEANYLRHSRPLPRWYWSGDTQMACAHDAIGQTLRYGYAHHIQRLMVTGLFALLAEVDPKPVADWYLAAYVDAVEWAELPNVAGMALYADGGRFTSKPYVASGAYIQRMSDHCDRCRYAPTPKDVAKTGKPACPFTVLYWNFLDRHEASLAANPRTAMMARSVAGLSAAKRADIRAAAAAVLARVDAL